MRQPTSELPRIHSRGRDRRLFEDFYHNVLRWPWWVFFLGAAVSFVGINLVFATLYSLQEGAVSNARSFEDCFYFSVQTLATIGYGGMAPASRYGHFLVASEALVGILSTALVTGMTFAKFSRPTARVLFSAHAVVTTRHGQTYLSFRMANWRHNSVAAARLQVSVLVLDQTPEGETLRVPLDLPLVRSQSPVFQLTWTAMHRIDEASPFYGPNALEQLRAKQAEIYLSFSGTDETVAQAIHARHRYRLEDIVWNARFADVLTVEPDGTRVIDYTHFHEVVALAASLDKS